KRRAQHGLRLLFHDGDEPAPHDLGVDLRERGVGAGDHGSSLVADELNIAEGVDAGVEARADDRRGLVFRDHRRAANTRSRRKIAPPINVHLPKLAGLAVEDRPPRARFWLAWPLEGRAAKVAFRGRAHGDNPAQYLDLDAGDGSTVKPAIGRLEQLPDG